MEECSKCKFAGRFRVKFLAAVTVLVHNFGYKDVSLLTHLGFGSSHHTLAGLDIQETSKSTPKSDKKKPKIQEARSQDYSPDSF